MDTVREVFAWLAMMSGFANALLFIAPREYLAARGGDARGSEKNRRSRLFEQHSRPDTPRSGRGGGFIPQLLLVRRRRQSGDIALSTYVSWLIIMAFGVIHLFLEHDYYYGAGLAASWFTCLATTLTVAYYRTRVTHAQELGA